MTEQTKKPNLDILRSLAPLYGFDSDNLTNADREQISRKALESSVRSDKGSEILANIAEDMVINGKLQQPFVSLQSPVDNDNKALTNIVEDMAINRILQERFPSLTQLDNENPNRDNKVVDKVKNVENIISTMRKNSSVDHVDSTKPKKN